LWQFLRKRLLSAAHRVVHLGVMTMGKMGVMMMEIIVVMNKLSSTIMIGSQ
jgi:hypothetical protein